MVVGKKTDSTEKNCEMFKNYKGRFGFFWEVSFSTHFFSSKIFCLLLLRLFYTFLSFLVSIIEFYFPRLVGRPFRTLMNAYALCVIREISN